MPTIFNALYVELPGLRKAAAPSPAAGPQMNRPEVIPAAIMNAARRETVKAVRSTSAVSAPGKTVRPSAKIAYSSTPDNVPPIRGEFCQNTNMTKIIGRLLSLSVAFWVATEMLPGVYVNGDLFTYVGLAFIFGLVNLTAGNLLRLFTFPITFLTLGLWSVVVNALMLLATDGFSDALFIETFWWALAAAVVIGFAAAVVNRVFNTILGK